MGCEWESMVCYFDLFRFWSGIPRGIRSGDFLMAISGLQQPESGSGSKPLGGTDGKSYSMIAIGKL
jgi:hypothetical protein